MKRLLICCLSLLLLLCACSTDTLTDTRGFLAQLRKTEKAFDPPQEDILIEQTQDGLCYSAFLNVLPPEEGEQLCLLRLYEQEDGHLKRCTVTYALQRAQEQEEVMSEAARERFMLLCASVVAAYTKCNPQEAEALLQAHFSEKQEGERRFEENWFRYKWLETQPGLSFTLENIRLNPEDAEALTLRESETAGKP